MLEKLEEIDEILAVFEDWLHGEDGNKCTHARKLIIELKASNNVKLPVMRWQDFIGQEPKHNQLVLIKDIETGQVTEEVWKASIDNPPFNYINSVWLPSPAIV